MNHREEQQADATFVNKELSRGGYGATGATFIKQKKDDDFNVELVDKMTTHFEKNVKDNEDLVRRAEEARAAMEHLASGTPAAYLTFNDFIMKALKDTRSARAAIEIESKLMLAELADIRKFFLDPKHEEEVAKLKEFVALCERLRELKNSGFLDTIADTILRLECGK